MGLNITLNNAANIDYLIRQVKDGKYVSSEYHNDPTGASVEMTKVDGIPAIHFQWHRVFTVEVPSITVKEQLSKHGIYAVENYSGTGWYALLRETHHQHIWFMNFRRYGWCWTDTKDGEAGYSGQIYANAITVFHMGTSMDMVIRDALVYQWAKLLETRRLPQFFDTHGVSKLLKELYTDALDNATDSARPWFFRKSSTDDVGEAFPIVRKDEDGPQLEAASI